MATINAKQSRSGGKAVDSEQTYKKPRLLEDTVTALIGMQDVWIKVISFLAHSERPTLAETCSGMLHFVEDYCRLALDDIVADEDFPQRLQQQAAVRRGCESEQKAFPYRYLLELAKTIHVYKLEMFHGVRNVNVRYAMSHDHDIIVIAGQNMERSLPPNPIVCNMWKTVDVDGRLHKKNKEIKVPAAEDEWVQNVYLASSDVGSKKRYCNDYWKGVSEKLCRIVICTNRRILVLPLDFDGDEVGAESLIRVENKGSGMLNNHTVAVIDHDRLSGLSRLHSFDIVTGETKTINAFAGTFSSEFVDILIVHNERWLVYRKGDFVRILDLRNNQFQPLGKFSDYECYIHRAPLVDDRDCDSSFYYFRDGTMQTLKLCSENGQFYSCDDKNNIRLGIQDYCGRVGKQAFFLNDEAAHDERVGILGGEKQFFTPSIDVVSTQNGKAIRTLAYPTNYVKYSGAPHEIQSTRLHLIVGLRPYDKISWFEKHQQVWRENPNLPGFTIAAYLAQEHF